MSKYSDLYGDHDMNFDRLLHSKLSALEGETPPDEPLVPTPFSYKNLPFPSPWYESKHVDTFNLPAELQGGIGNISSRRPSYAAESFTRSQQEPVAPPNPALYRQNPSTASYKNSLASLAAVNSFSMNTLVLNGYDAYVDNLQDSFQNVSLNGNLSDFQARRPSQLADVQSLPQRSQPVPFGPPFPQFHVPFGGPALPLAGSAANVAPAAPPASSAKIASAAPMKLDNGLLLKELYILALPEIKQLYLKTTRYFEDVSQCNELLAKLRLFLADPVVQKLITFMKNLNNLTFNHKMLCLVVNKNGKLDLLLYPNSSNIYLQRDDLVIVDGDRGKDLVMILDPLVNLNFAILFNFLKKIEHLKSLTINDAHGGTTVKGHRSGGTHPTLMDASKIINNLLNEDNEFIITLPTKQVLRFATPEEVERLSGKFLEEKKAFITCFNKIKELGLSDDLTLINVEYQCDFKKLIFYYYANFKRIDFRGLIKELFKIFKTRIWLCAVLPFDRPELYTGLEPLELSSELGRVPQEYELSNDQIMLFSIGEFERLPKPSYFHSRNMMNLVRNMEAELGGMFYGFGDPGRYNGGPGVTGVSSAGPTTAANVTSTAPPPNKPAPGLFEPRRPSIQPSFDPFGDVPKKI